MIDTIKELENVNNKIRKHINSNDFIETFDALNENDKEKLLQELHLSVTNAKILTNKLINNEWK